MSQIIQVLCLVLIIEGIMPLLAPKAVKKLASEVSSRPENHIRVYGLSLMLMGIISLLIFS